MIQWAKIITVLFLGMFAVNCGFGEEMALFVSPQGSDANSGTKDRPFKTLEAARDAVRKTKHSKEIVVWLRAGVHEREKTGELHRYLSEELITMGAFFSRPYGPWADMVYRRATTYTTTLKEVKKVFDPNNILNPGKLCY